MYPGMSRLGLGSGVNPRWSRGTPRSAVDEHRSRKVAALLDGSDPDAAGTFIAVVPEGEHAGTFPATMLRSLEPSDRSRRSVAIFGVLVLVWATFLLVASVFWNVSEVRPGEVARELDPIFFAVPALVLVLASVVSLELARWGPVWMVVALFSGAIVWAFLMDVRAWWAIVGVASAVVGNVLVARSARVAWWRSVEPLLTDHVHVRARVVDIPRRSEHEGLAGNAVLVMEAHEVPGRQWFMVCHAGLTGIRDLEVRVGATIDLFYAASAPHLAVLRPVATGLSRPGAVRRFRDTLLLSRDVAGRAPRQVAYPQEVATLAPPPAHPSTAYPLVGYPTTYPQVGYAAPTAQPLVGYPTAVPVAPSDGAGLAVTPDARARAELAARLAAETSTRTALTMIVPVVGDEAPSDVPRARLARLDPRHAGWRALASVLLLEVVWTGALLGADAWWGAPGDGFRAGIDAAWIRWALAVVPWIVGWRVLVWSSRVLGWVRAWPAHLIFAVLLVAWAVHDGWHVAGYWHYVAVLLVLTLTARGSRCRRVAWARRTGVTRPDHVATVARIEDVLWAGTQSPRRDEPVLVVASDRAPDGRWYVVRRLSAPGVADVRFVVGDPVVVLYRPGDPAVAVLRPVPENRGTPARRRGLSRGLRSVLGSFRDATGFTTPPRTDPATVEPTVTIPPPGGRERTVFGPGS